MFRKIHLLMLSKGINKAELQKAIGVSSGNLSDWANGRSQPSVSKLIKIADYFNVTLDYLCDRGTGVSLSSEAEELVKIYDALDKEGRVVVMAAAYTQKQRMSGVLVEE